MKRESFLRRVCMISRSTGLPSLGLIILALAGGANASASMIYTNFGAGLSYDVLDSNPVGNAFDGTGSNYAEGSSFTPGSTANFGSLIIALSCVAANCPGADTVVVSLDADNSDSPGAVLESFTVLDSLLGPLGSNNAPLVLTSIVHPALTSSTRYWVTVSTTFVNDSIAWNLNNTGDVNDQANSADGGVTWFSPSGFTPGAFEVDSVPSGVPEPGSTGLVGGGLLVLLLAKARSEKMARRT